MNQRTGKIHTPPDTLAGAFDRYYPILLKYFILRGVDSATANDLTASVFERALKNIHHYDPARAQIQTWLFVIAHNIGVNYWKSQKSETELKEEVRIDEDPVEDIVVLALDKQDLLLAVQQLDQRSGEIIAMKFSARFSNREIAEITGLSESNVGVILYRALGRLRKLLTVEVQHD